MSGDRDQLPEGIDVVRTDESGDVDLAQIEHNLSLTVEQRIDQHLAWMRFLEVAREAGRRYYGMDPRRPETPQ